MLKVVIINGKHNINFNLFQNNNQHDDTYGLSFISGVVFIHSLHVSSFRKAHHQKFIFPVQSASGIVYNLCCIPTVLLRVLQNE